MDSKIHFTINDKGGIIDFIISPGNTADNNKEVVDKITKKHIW